MNLYFSMNMSVAKYLPYYQGRAERIEVFDDAGRRIWINGRHFRSFLTNQGVAGRFCLQLDDQGNFVKLEKV
ncbi:DUF2835 domain-containing protein [Shewanella gelidii]|uniref:DUF2835 family protein n=1 Tax=Shewanella gelidii TaxID=1642821 RepID=A0A917NE07_9GAMM|nr:DUF2835 domain-containing protein [Shewanella gelidii]GGI88638.1 hypothetical protein GCM10009332_27600 [Shewanella gelidii]